MGLKRAEKIQVKNSGNGSLSATRTCGSRTISAQAGFWDGHAPMNSVRWRSWAPPSAPVQERGDTI